MRRNTRSSILLPTLPQEWDQRVKDNGYLEPNSGSPETMTVQSQEDCPLLYVVDEHGTRLHWRKGTIGFIP